MNITRAGEADSADAVRPQPPRSFQETTMPNYMKPDSRIYIAGHRGLVGSAITRSLQQQGYTNLLLRTRTELDLLNTKAVNDFFAGQKPDFVFFAAAKVGGI